VDDPELLVVGGHEDRDRGSERGTDDLAEVEEPQAAGVAAHLAAGQHQQPAVEDRGQQEGAEDRRDEDLHDSSATCAAPRSSGSPEAAPRSSASKPGSPSILRAVAARERSVQSPVRNSTSSAGTLAGSPIRPSATTAASRTNQARSSSASRTRNGTR